MANFYQDNDDLQFYLHRWIDWDPLVRLTEYDFKAVDAPANTAEAVESYDDILRMVGEFVAAEVAPHAAEIDRQHPEISNGQVITPPVQVGIFDQLAEMGMHGMCLPRELGGLNVPILVFSVQHELFSRADVSVCAHNGFHGGMALAMLAYSIDEGSTVYDPELPGITSTRFQEAIDEIAAGQAWGSMDITESDAGSDMARLRCRASLDDDGVWRVTGQKIYITSGHGKYHFVIARTEAVSDPADDFAGLQGLSMFLVPAWEDTPDGERRMLATFDSVEHKLGHNGSATVAISYEDTPGHLIGARGEGFKHMLKLMNGARVGVGFEALGMCEAAYRQSIEYAAQRTSMGKTIDRHEIIAEYLEEMQTDIHGIRALAMHAGWHDEMAKKIDIQLKLAPPADEDERAALQRRKRRHTRTARESTPLLKFYAGEKTVDIARRNMQIHGGAGYTKDYGAEKILRDAMVLPVYEGTSQIQALMAMKDTLLGVVKNPQRFVRQSATARFDVLRARDGRERAMARLRVLRNRTVRFLLQRLATAKLGELRHRPFAEWAGAMQGWDPKRDFSLALLHAERLTEILTQVKIAELLVAQAARFPERHHIADRWLERAEPRCRFLEDTITTTGQRLLRELAGPTDAAAEAAK
ncbi:MAG: alkylation response protein AidB-like acyl-CoA dehydrogenase [Myxococcota bacterium]|jgi:alkylation response protein AidB-like acyl-CoA dehydrogenase